MEDSFSKSIVFYINNFSYPQMLQIISSLYIILYVDDLLEYSTCYTHIDTLG